MQKIIFRLFRSVPLKTSQLHGFPSAVIFTVIKGCPFLILALSAIKSSYAPRSVSRV